MTSILIIHATTLPQPFSTLTGQWTTFHTRLAAPVQQLINVHSVERHACEPASSSTLVSRICGTRTPFAVWINVTKSLWWSAQYTSFYFVSREFSSGLHRRSSPCHLRVVSLPLEINGVSFSFFFVITDMILTVIIGDWRSINGTHENRSSRSLLQASYLCKRTLDLFLHREE